MNKEKVSIISILINIFLAVIKLIVGFIINSVALISDGIHSFLDIISSIISYLGIKIAQKPVDEKHPYGYYVAETLAGLGITILLAVSAGWIIYEGVEQIRKQTTVNLAIWGFLVVIISIILNEIIARLKFKYGEKEESLALIADAEHSRADALSSIGVLIGLILATFFIYADGIIAILIGLYILKESYNIGRTTTDNLLGVKDEKTEKIIKNICQTKNIEISDLKTRKIGSATFAELTIKLKKDLKVNQAEEISKELQEELLNKISLLKQVVIQIESHNIKQGIIRPRFGQRYGFRGKFEKIGPTKKGYRIIIPIKNNEIYNEFGSPRYLIIDKKNNKITQKEIIKNPHFNAKGGHGIRFVKSVEPDEIITKTIGNGAKQKLKDLNIKINLIKPDTKLKDIKF
ncbi:MAG: cation diffusion facilitator family transporter [Candidatus Buchananbacteria bacterium]|nr:cation diffusion facilitator family transporter [Candidatus Buchananbacteria bacterium]